MSDINDPMQPQDSSHVPQPEPAAASAQAGFCQHCGRPLDAETVRRVGPAVYCEPCLAAKIGVPGGVPGGYSAGYGAGTGPSYAAGYGAGYGPVRTGSGPGAPWASASLPPSVPNPGLAALLGLIPGVGAMYNEQYAKGVVHLVVFAVLVSFANHVSDIFGVLVFGWICYMAIEAHHTARARRDGTPLPNPFGLNDIGERFGFGRAWPSGPPAADVARDAAAAAATAFQGATAAPPRPQDATQTRAAWSAPQESYGQPVDPGAAYKDVFVQAAYDQAYRDAGYGPSIPPVPPVPPFATPYTPVSPALDPTVFAAAPPSRFPAGAVWLIALGVLFLLATIGLFNTFPPEALVGCVVLGFGIWAFVHRMTETGSSFSGDGSPTYTLRIMRALRWSVWLALIGTLFVLDALNILTWHYSWPFLIILPGVMAILERAVHQSLPNPYMPQPSTQNAPRADSSSKGGN